MGTPRNTVAERMSLKMILGTCGLALTLLMTPSVALSAFKLKKSPEPVEVEAEPSPAFDRSEYEVWVDHTYTAVVEYGRSGHIARAPSYGDTMLLEDALKLLLPEKWQAMRSRELASEGNMLVSWDVAQANWIDVLENLGERHGLRFHIDHTNQEVFIQNGRQLIFDRSLAADAPKQAQEQAETEQGKVWKRQPEDVPSESVSFSIFSGDPAQRVLEDLALLLGYEKTYWMMGDKSAAADKTLEGNRMTVLSEAAKEFGGKACLYEGQNVAAFVSKSQECPR